MNRMDLQKYAFFGFDESNFASEKKKMLDYLASLGRWVNIQCLKAFPPCVLGDEADVKVVGKEIVFSSKDFLVNHNLFFGKDFVEINKRFKDSPFISGKCKECEHFKSFFCRGLFNKKFLDIKNKIVMKRSKFHYDSLTLDYSYGIMGYTSECCFNCKSCGDRRKLSTFLAFINPPLSINEINHFLHYIPSWGVYSNLFTHGCLTGEPLMHKDIEQILRLMRLFILDTCRIVTNGYFLDDSLLGTFSELGYILDLSVNSVNKNIRKNMMGYSKDIDIKALIGTILKKKIKLTPRILALKENILNGDLKETVLYLKEKGLRPLICANICSLYQDESEIENLNYPDDFLKSYLKENGLLDFVDLECDSVNDVLPSLITRLKEKIKNQDKGSRIVLLSPECSYNELNKAFDNDEKVHVEKLVNKFRSNRSLSASLTIDVFLGALSKISYEYDIMFIPSGSFNIFMNDIEGNNIKELVSKIGKKVILIG